MATYHPPLCWSLKSQEFIASVITPCCAVTLPATYNQSQNNVRWRHIIQSSSFFLWCFTNWYKLDPESWLSLYFSAVVVMSIVKQKRKTKEVGRGGWTVLEESNGVVEAGLELSGSLNMNKLHCCKEIFASCLYYPLYSVWMWLPGEHHDKKKCTPQKKGRRRENGYW